ncbi:DUF1097 domain-containing protein [Wohlfahrtiimonas larvae]|uniref:DUF1097 domain-containing protein n=1 Tax=Wohlfahrtiimonas larvae TaxID=1157986 RepID=A0ABP9N1D8_9GAMM|nr:DUF1097 domain-containing protein [Wohlfahrtiimonas larvae]
MQLSRSIWISALVTGVLCGIWAGFASLVYLNVWAGFAGCTAYFASGKPGPKGMILTWCTTLIGAFLAYLMIVIDIAMVENISIMNTRVSTAIAVGALVALIMLLGNINWLSFIPGMFVGCYTYFAIDGFSGNNWLILMISLVTGAVLGLACDSGGKKLSAL